MTQLLRGHNLMVSRDGFGSGEGQSLERHLKATTAPIRPKKKGPA